MDVKVASSGGKLTRVISRSHLIDVGLSDDAKQATVSISKAKLEKAGLKEVPDRDFVLLYRDRAIGEPSILLQKSND